MKTKNLFLVTILTFLGLVLECNGQEVLSGGADLKSNIGSAVFSNLNDRTSDENLGVGYYSGGIMTSGTNSAFLGGHKISQLTPVSTNVFVGAYSGHKVTSGSSNVFLGYSSGPATIGSYSNKLYIDNLFPGNDTPLIFGDFLTENLTFNVKQSNTSRVSINSGVPYVVSTVGTSGLKLNNLRSGNTVNAASSAGKVLSVDVNGDVILVNDAMGLSTLSSACTTVNFIPKTSNINGNLTCSQIFDNGIGVGVGYSVIPTDLAFFNYNFNPIFYTNYTGNNGVNSTNAVKFHVNGNTRANGIWTTSDKKFKKDIKSIESALETVQSLEGKTYLWDLEKNKEMNFDAGGHSGFLAQDLEKVLPHLVITAQNGDKAVNYMELMPYLVEAIKAQQVQINDLKVQIGDNFKASNKDLLNLQNTKIISVSPNPSKDVITISFNVEKSVQSATLNVHDLNGNVLSSLNVKDRDTNLTRTIQKDNFGKGIYIVSLVVNGKSIDTKKIIFE